MRKFKNLLVGILAKFSGKLLAAAIKHVPGLEVSMKFMQWS